MRTDIGADDRQFLELLNRMGAATVQSLCSELDVTATAVRQRLTRLQAGGLISRGSSKSGRGRPSHEYSVTDTGLQLLGDNYRDLALVLWREIKGIEDSTLRGQIMNRIKDSLVTRYRQTVVGETLADRVEQLGVSLNQYGFNTETDLGSDLPILRENNCPYLELANDDPSICDLEHSVFEEVLGAEMTLSRCCLDGHHCCEFQPANEG